MKPLVLIVLSSVMVLSPAGIPSARIDILRNEAETQFPDRITFHLSASSSASIESVHLEFGTDAAACGESTARVVPDDFVPGLSVTTGWTWDLRRTGPLPPGTEVWWRWVVRDAAGEERTTPDQAIVVEDTQHAWRTTAADEVNLNWYTGDSRFAGTLLEAAEDGLATLREATGVDYDGEIRLYVYADPADMQAATLFAPDWSGGLAFPEHGAVLASIAPGELEWGRRVVAHELAHVVLGQYTFSCMDSTPNWVAEGLAMYAEGEAEPGYILVLDEAVREGTLLPVRSLSRGFSNDPELAVLGYAQSYSLVAFLVEDYGQDRMMALLDQFREGALEEQALQRVYNFGRDGLDEAWRASVGATRAAGDVPAEVDSTATPYPTYAPLGAPNAAPATREAGVSSVAATPPPANEQADLPDKAAPGLCATPGVVGAVGLCLMSYPRARRRGGARRREE